MTKMDQTWKTTENLRILIPSATVSQTQGTLVVWLAWRQAQRSKSLECIPSPQVERAPREIERSKFESMLLWLSAWQTSQQASALQGQSFLLTLHPQKGNYPHLMHSCCLPERLLMQ